MEAGKPVAVATITRIQGSSSRPLASRMMIAGEEEFAGSVSGGCVERDVTAAAAPVLQGGAPRLLEYGQVDDPELEVGLNCEGTIDVLLEPLTEELLSMLRREAGTTLVTRYTEHPDGSVTALEHELTDDKELLALNGPVFRRNEPEPAGTVRMELAEPRHPRPLLLVFGADTVAYPLTRLARTMGYRVVVADPRATYARAQEIPDADEVLCAWPREFPQLLGTGPGGLGNAAYVVSLTHEPRFEDDLFRMLMTVPQPAYLGCMGKHTRQLEREARQAASGFDLSALPPIHTPIGLDLAGKAPEDIALSIMAEVQAVRNGRSGEPLSRGRSSDLLRSEIRQTPRTRGSVT
jgi:xanthine dehydrogenase accessory factor